MGYWLSTRRLHVNINLLRAAAEQSSAEHEQRNQNYYHEDRDNRHDAGAAATSSIISYVGILLLNEPEERGRKWGEVATL